MPYPLGHVGCHTLMELILTKNITHNEGKASFAYKGQFIKSSICSFDLSKHWSHICQW
jgi:hypothetical protein